MPPTSWSAKPPGEGPSVRNGEPACDEPDNVLSMGRSRCWMRREGFATMSMDEIWRLSHFLAVAEAGSLHAAARRINISQPALTKSIRMLEESLGTALFVRLPRGVRTTEAGEILRQRAREIETAWNAAVVEIDAQGAGSGGSMHIGAGPVYSAVYLPNTLAELRRRFPRLRVVVSTGVGDDLLPALKLGDIRAYAGGVPNGAMALGPDFETEPLYEQSNAVFASEHHAIFKQGECGPADTLRYPWLCLFSGNQANSRIATYFAQLGLASPSIALESHSLQIALKMIADHEFLACMPVPLVRAFPEARLREVALDGFRWSIPTGVTYHRASIGFAPLVTMLRSLRRLTVGADR